jgi:hypothetical protein
MKTRTLTILVTLLLAISLTACVPGGNQEPAPDDSANAIATSVAATLGAGDGESTSPTWTVQPSETVSVPVPDIVFQGVSFSYDPSLAENITADVLPEQADEGGPWWSTPETISFTLNGYALPGAFLDARINVYNVADFTAVNPTVGERLDTLQDILAVRDVNDDRIAMADVFNAAQFLRTKVAFLDFQNGSGVRFLSQYGQAFSSVGLPYLFFGYQGLTGDGQYFISAIFPVNHPTLPGPESVVLDDAFAENFENYIAENEASLQGQPDESFQPSLVTLDQLISSLLVEP